MHTMKNKLIVPSALSLVKNVGDLKLMSGKMTTIRSKGTERFCFQTRPNMELSTTEELASATEHCTAYNHIHSIQTEALKHVQSQLAQIVTDD